MAPPPPPPPPPPEINGVAAALNEPLPSQNMLANGPTSPPAEQSQLEPEQKVWERPWTLDEMRKGAHRWSLAGDAGLLLYLEQFSKRMIARTHETGQEVDGLVGDLKATDVRVHNVFNEFIHLANTQFVENRVYDEDVNTEAKEEEKKPDQQEKTREQRESELIPKMCEAIKYGLEVVDTAFEKLDVDVANSDSEDEDVTYNVDPILEAKDPYLNRPLPFIIGTAQFMQHDDVGLAEVSSEEEEVSDHGSISESESESEGEIEKKSKVKDGDMSESSETGTESESEEDSDTEKKPRKSIKKAVDSDSEEGDLFGSEKESEESTDEEDEQAKKSTSGGPGGFASELAAKIGVVPQGRRSSDEDDRGDDDDWEEEPKPKSKERSRTASIVSNASKKEKKSKSKSKSKRESKKAASTSDDLFGPPPDEDDDSPFGAKGGLFSGGGGLFDDDEPSGGLFDDVPVKKKAVSDSEDSVDDHEEVEKKEKHKENKRGRTRSGHKIPAGGVSIFGDGGADPFAKVPSNISDEEAEEVVSSKKSSAPSGGLFDDDDADNLFSAAPTKSVAEKSTKPVKKSSTANLFADDDNEDDLFASISKPKKKPESKPTASLFADDDEGDLFGEAPAKVAEPKVEQKKETKKKMPAGAVSMFGGAPNPLAAAIKAQRQASDNEEEDEWSDASIPKTSGDKFSRSGSGSSVTSSPALAAIKQQGKPTRSGSSSSNSLFAEEPEITSVKPKESKPKAKPTLGLFDDDDDEDFFSAKPAQPSKARAASKTLFTADDEEDLFSDKTTKPADSTDKKKPTGGVALFGGQDLFGTSPEKIGEKPKATAEEKSVKKPPAKTALSLFDDDNDDDLDSGLFGGGAKKSSETSKPRSKSNLFDDDSLLFSAKEDDPSVDLFSSTSPLGSPSKSEKKPDVKSGPVQKPVLFEDKEETKPTKKSEPKPIKSAKAAPSSDLFGSPSPKEDLFSSNPKRPTESKKSVPADSLFGSPSPKDDLFSSNPKRTSERSRTASSDDPLADPVSTNPKRPPEDSLEIPKAEEDQETAEPEVKKPWRPAGAVSMFGAFDPMAMINKNKKGKAADPLAGTSPEPTTEVAATTTREPESESPGKPVEDLFGSPAKERSTSSSSVDGPTPFGSAGMSPPKFKSVSPPKTSKAIGGLQAGLAINPAAMLPGAKPPSREPEPSAVGFDTPAEARTLHSANKDRAKVQTKRRPPTRAARVAAAKQSDTVGESTTDIPTSSKLDSVDGIASRLPPMPSGPSDALGEDLFGSSTQSKAMESDRIDTFSSTGTTKSGALVEEDLFSSPVTESVKPMSTGTSKSKSKTNLDDDLFSKPSEDLFSAKPKKQATEDIMDIFDTKPSEKTNILADDDDLFKDKTSDKVPTLENKSKAATVEDDIFADATVATKDEDLFGSPAAKPKSKKKAAPTDDIFADDTDIFVDLPPSKPKEKKKKAATANQSLFKSNADDIFADSSSKPKTKKTTTKKKTSKNTAASSASIFDSDAPSIFDDPLNAMK